MNAAEAAEFYKWFARESSRLEDLYIRKWNNIFARRQFDTLDLLDLIELSVQIDYLRYIEQRIQKLLLILRTDY